MRRALAAPSDGELVVEIGHKLRPRLSGNKCAEPGDVARARAVERLPPRYFGLEKAGPVEVPQRIVAEELAARAAQHGPPRLPANLFWRGIVLALVGRLHQHKGADGCFQMVGAQRTPEVRLVTVDSIHSQPRLIAKRIECRGLAAVRSYDLDRAAVTQTGSQFVASPAFGFRQRVVATRNPHNIWQVLEAFANEASVAAQSRGSRRLDFLEKAFIPAAPAKIGRKKPDGDAALVCHLDGAMRAVEVIGIRLREIAWLEERPHTIDVRGRLRGELVLDQTDNDRVETALLPVVQVARDVLLAQLRDERPSRVTHDEEGLA